MTESCEFHNPDRELRPERAGLEVICQVHLSFSTNKTLPPNLLPEKPSNQTRWFPAPAPRSTSGSFLIGRHYVRSQPRFGSISPDSGIPYPYFTGEPTALGNASHELVPAKAQ